MKNPAHAAVKGRRKRIRPRDTLLRQPSFFVFPSEQFCSVSGTLLPPCKARFEPQDATDFGISVAHMVDHIDDASEPRGRVRYPCRGGAPASLERRDQGADRREIICARRGGVGGSAPTRHVAAASVWLAQGGAGRFADIAGRRGADVCTDREGFCDDGVAAAVGVTVSGVITIEIAGAVVRAERGVDLGLGSAELHLASTG